MYEWYAPDPRMKANVGIRRLAPLLDNSRPQIELINALLLSLPGSPCLYYGDEIGMGDNIWLGDRDAVRTPMQWSPDRNAGFSEADPGKLYLPVNTSLSFHHNSVNVEAALASPESLLHWTRAMLALRKAHPVFGIGTFEALDAATRRSCLPARRPNRDRTHRAAARSGALRQQPCSAPQATTIRLAPEFAGATVRDLFGGNGFGPVAADASLTLTLAPRGFYWLQLGDPSTHG